MNKGGKAQKMNIKNSKMVKERRLNVKSFAQRDDLVPKRSEILFPSGLEIFQVAQIPFHLLPFLPLSPCFVFVFCLA